MTAGGSNGGRVRPASSKWSSNEPSRALASRGRQSLRGPFSVALAEHRRRSKWFGSVRVGRLVCKNASCSGSGQGLVEFDGAGEI